MRSPLILAAAAFSALVGLVAGAILLTSAWLDFAGDRSAGTRDVYRVHAALADAFRAAATRDFSIGAFDAELAGAIASADASIAAATIVTRAGAVMLTDETIQSPELAAIAGDARFFDFFTSGGPAAVPDAPGVWLTRSGAARLSAAGGGLGPRVRSGEALLDVLGVIDDPRPGSHLVYEAVLTGAGVQAGRDGALYVRTRDRAAAARALGPVLARAEGFPAGVLDARLTRFADIRLSPRPDLGTPSFIVAGQRLEFVVALITGGAAAAGAALSV
ncbi:MAG: hypothetical protein ACOC05_10485, partial [Oceanicaulis sp.]